MSNPSFAPAAGDPVPGLGSWLLERKLGGGGFGAVWLAKHAFDRDQAPRAVKFCTDPQARHRLVTHERNVVVRVMKYAGKHPNIVPLLEFNLDGPVPWLMYEYVEGGTLAELIDQWAALEVPKRLGRAVKVLHGIASGLAACHRLSPPLVHRDMKPQNVLMAGAVPRITDFGIGSVAFDPQQAPATGAKTAFGARIPSLLKGAGTRAYCPPEQMLGGAPHPREDVYALGVMAYQLVRGDIYTGPGSDAGDELRELKVPKELADLMVRSVAVKPERRPVDATEWVATLDSLLTHSRPQPVPPVPPPTPVVILESPQQPTERQWAQATEREPRRSSGSRTERPTTRRPRRKPRRRNWVAIGCVVGLLAALTPALWFVLRPAPNGGSTPQSAERPQDKDTGRTRQGLGDRVKDDVKGLPPLVVPKSLGSSVVPRVGAPPLAEQFPANPKPGQECDIEIAPGVKMRFCWVPPGECQLGSPKVERDQVAYDTANEAEEIRGKFRTPGFWLGKYEVTQGEWAAVMRGTKEETPSSFRVGGDAADKLGSIIDTNRFPVENVSWDMISASDGFLERANTFARGGRADVRRGRFGLPHENEWEYACRGGLGNGRPFYFGTSCNGNQANCKGTSPFGTNDAGPDLQHTTAVGAYAGKVPHPWGLCDMHGNVWEWCENMYDTTGDCVQRGGSWYRTPRSCRSAFRFWSPRWSSGSNRGFRVIIRIE